MTYVNQVSQVSLAIQIRRIIQVSQVSQAIWVSQVTLVTWVKQFILMSRVSQQVCLTDPPQHPLGKPGRRESLPQHCLKPPDHQNVHHQHGPQDIFLQPHRGLPGKQSLTHNKYSEMQMMAKLQKAV